MKRLRPVATMVLASLGVFLLGGLAGILATGPSRQHFDFLYTDFRIESCLENRQRQAGVEGAPDEGAIVTCYNQLRLQGQLNEYLVRRVNFQNQNFANNVVLWMVVVLTLAGVALAGFQIVATTRIGGQESTDTAQPTNEILIERGRLFLRSSITGLIILVVSFGFFYTYVSQVYRINSVGDKLKRIYSLHGQTSTGGQPPPRAPPIIEEEDEAPAADDLTDIIEEAE